MYGTRVQQATGVARIVKPDMYLLQEAGFIIHRLSDVSLRSRLVATWCGRLDSAVEGVISCMTLKDVFIYL